MVGGTFFSRIAREASVDREVSFTIELVAIPQNSEGAARFLAQLAKPTNVPAGMKKLRDFHDVLEGYAAGNNRSREQVYAAVSTVWQQLRHAVEVGDWFDRACLFRNRAQFDAREPVQEYARPLAGSLDEKDKQTVWKPFLPVAHMAGGFRQTLFQTRRGRYFYGKSVPRSVQLSQIRDLLYDDHEWLAAAVEAGEARMVLPKLMGMQPPARTRLFVLTDRFSQESTPGSQNGTPASP